jgi:hypothetical protein
MKSTSSFSNQELGLNINAASASPTSNQGDEPSLFDLISNVDFVLSSMSGNSSTRSQPYQPTTTKSLSDIIQEALAITEDFDFLDPSPED